MVSISGAYTLILYYYMCIMQHIQTLSSPVDNSDLKEDDWKTKSHSILLNDILSLCLGQGEESLIWLSSLKGEMASNQWQQR